MSGLEARGVSGTRLPRVDLLCEAGLHALVVEDVGAGAELVDILAGLARPRRGRLRLGNENPFKSPELRRRTGTLLLAEPPLEGASVEMGVGRVLALHGSPLKAADVLHPFGLTLLAPRPPASLNGAERRAVALAIALGVRPASLLVLHEPFATSLDRTLVGKVLAERAKQSIVIAVTASLRDARALGGHVLSLTGTGLLPRRAPGAGIVGLELVVVTPEPKRLADALEAAEGPHAGWACERRPTELVLRGADVESLSLLVMRASRDSGVPIASISQRFEGAIGRQLIDEALRRKERISWPFSRGNDPGREG